MKRLNQNTLQAISRCPHCFNRNIKENSAKYWHCANCKATYYKYKNKPVLLRKDNELFPPNAYVATSEEKTNRPSKFHKIKRLIPSRSINLVREEKFELLATRVGEEPKTILVIGCGNQVAQIESIFPYPSTSFVFCDIDINAEVDLFCDSHELPFQDSSFDGVITTAVLEHVLYPEKVAGEIHRVLKLGGFVYSEIPFLQAVHEGAYDFTRYSLSGHRRLFEYFSEEDAGMVAGPATSFLWSLDMLLRSLSSNKRLSRAFSIGGRLLFGWIKYIDKLIANNAIAMDAASCTFYLGIKSNNKRSATSIIDAYGNSGFRHT
jgi:SAM-dependent methyltransferase